MQLSAEEIIKRKIINNYCKEGIQQQGIDVRIKGVSKVDKDDIGIIPINGKTKALLSNNIQPMTFSEEGGPQWVLEPGYYDIILEEGCKIPNNAVLNFKTRSSLVRCYAEVTSGQFDAGFETENMGCFLKVNQKIIISKGARIAQAIITETYPVNNKDLYMGQWQKDNQRNMPS